MIKSKKRIFIGFALTGIAITVGGRIPYFIMYFYWMFILIPMIHCAIGRLSIDGEVRITDGELLSGEDITIDYTIKNKSFLNFPYLSINRSFHESVTGEKMDDMDFYLGSSDDISRTETIKCKRRGHYKIGEIVLVIKDMTGRYDTKKAITTPLSLKVYPKVARIGSLKVDAREAIGELSINNKNLEDYSEISSLRSYVDGDHIKKIHWKASQKIDKYMVKCYESKGDSELIILLDSCVTNYKDDDLRKLEDKCVDLAVSTIYYSLSNGMRVNLVFRDGEKQHSIRGNNIDEFKVFMDKLYDFKPTSGISLEHQIEGLSNTSTGGSTVMILSPMVDKKIAVSAIGLREKNFMPHFFIMKPLSDDGVEMLPKGVSTSLKAYGISVEEINVKDDVRDVLEVKHGKVG